MVGLLPDGRVRRYGRDFCAAVAAAASQLSADRRAGGKQRVGSGGHAAGGRIPWRVVVEAGAEAEREQAEGEGEEEREELENVDDVVQVGDVAHAPCRVDRPLVHLLEPQRHGPRIEARVEWSECEVRAARGTPLVARAVLHRVLA